MKSCGFEGCDFHLLPCKPTPMPPDPVAAPLQCNTCVGRTRLLMPPDVSYSCCTSQSRGETKRLMLLHREGTMEQQNLTEFAGLRF